ncbi:MAG: U32 family peptidase [Geothrix sp.]|uniref:peptidase U32 family protein n=1 Tax=Geothrix sp. TaxID=1962974 RepID=UPI003BAE483E
MALELLAPAKNADQGILALRCGADAVYMGGPQFGARQAAGNDLADFEQVTREARLWGAKVFATLNTILFDAELQAARRQAWDLYQAGVDALIIQDMAFLEMDLPPIPIHASTQAVCDSPEKVAFLASAGFSRAILAREVSLDDIRAIHRAADIELEAFVFGALCVGDSGQCYLSGAICERSGNRGECAQPCRAPWNLVDASNHVVVREKHLLNIRDLDLSDHLEDLADAGIQSFKIEGRLKDADYVKNIVSEVRRKLDALLHRRPELGCASLGAVTHAFTPDPTKTFQRGLSTYRIDGQRQRMGNLDSGKHLGEPIGEVRSIQGDRVVLDAVPELNPGDGLAFVDGAEVAGTVVNAVEGRQVFVQDPSRIRPGTRLHRNLDLRWLKALRSAKVERRIPVTATLDFAEGSVRLCLEDSAGFVAVAQAPGDFGPSRDTDATAQATRDALGRLGNTPFELSGLQVAESRFVPVSVLNALRRDTAAALEAQRRAPRAREPRRAPALMLNPLPVRGLDYSWNITNKAARAFYERAGAEVLEAAGDLQEDLSGRVVMTTRHCVKFEMGWCHVHQNPEPWTQLPEPQGPVFLENGTTRLECRFDCARCRMELVLCEPRERG